LHGQIENLQDLKARLISDVVTGKIDVRGVEVPEFAPVEEEAGTDMNEEEVGEEID
jgi:type I restriction enzyme S subunit